ncbi:MAG: hypothetical protein HZA16_00360 [Nitrospirae bacterium]|nr:hypothetical protein [Nitrospirota bacterium]
MSDTLSQKLSRFFNSDKFPWLIIFLGSALRLVRYLHNPSLWFDESRNAMGIISRSLSDLVPPAPDQTLSIPLGFYMLEKLAIQILGYGEYALKLFPLFFGIISLFLFYKVSKQYIRPKAVPVALGLFAVLDPLVELSSTLKPYTGDAAIALLLYAVSYAKEKNLNAFRSVLLGALGAAAVLFSHPAVFVLAGIGTTLSMSYLIKKEWSKMKGLSITLLMWGAGFLVVYIIFTKPLLYNFTITNDSIFWMKQKAFMPFPPMSMSDIQWFIDLPLRIFSFPVGMTFTGLAALTFIAGCAAVYSGNRERFFLLISPFILTLLASSLHKFVFSQATILFLVPSIILFIAEGTGYIREKTGNGSNIIGIALVCLIFIHPLAWSTYHAVKPNSREEIKPVLAHIKKNWQEGDVLYVYYMSQFAFEYYSKYHPGDYHFDDSDYVIGQAPQNWYATYKRNEFKGFWDPAKPFYQPFTDVLNGYTMDLNKLRGGKRVWILFSSMVSKEGIHEEKFFIYHLNSIGRQLDFFGHPGVSAVYLYDLS